MTAAPKDAISNDYDQLATQWFIVSDLGLTAYSGHDGIDVFIHSLASAEPNGSVEVRLIARNNEVLAAKPTDKNGFVHFEAGLARGEGGQAPAAIVAADKSDYAFLSLKTAAFDLSDRGVAGRQVPAGLDAFVYHRARRLSQRRNRARHVAVARCAGHCRGGAPDSGHGAAGRRRIPPRAGARPGPRRPCLERADCVLRLDRHLAREGLYRSQAAGGRRSHLHGRGLCGRPHRIRSKYGGQSHSARRAGASERGRAFPLRRAGFQSRSVRLGVDRGGEGTAGLCRLCVRVGRR